MGDFTDQKQRSSEKGIHNREKSQEFQGGRTL